MMRDDKQKLIVIGGPTASGKSSVAVELARHFRGEILNADSMQVYRGMDVGTAKPSMEERRGINHHLLDVVDPDEDFNAALYRSMALPLINEMARKQKLCFVVGGTGLYIKALLGGLMALWAGMPAAGMLGSTLAVATATSLGAPLQKPPNVVRSLALVGIGTLIEKSFEGGRALLDELGVPIESLVVIADMSDGRIVFAE